MALPIVASRLQIVALDVVMAQSVYANSRDVDNERFLPDEVFESINDARERIGALVANYGRKDKPLVFAVTLIGKNEQIGHLQAIPGENGWEVGYHIAKAHTGKGYATEALEAFLAPAMAYLGLSKINGVCHVDNIASRRVMEKCGFILGFIGMGCMHGVQQPLSRYSFEAKSPT
ncbi:MAG: GNAT family N-acetyltransferase [Eubacteriaceae bacterium]|nr:GNAT family N-acetyltransferase [Eubacteriaceae bacterium]